MKKNWVFLLIIGMFFIPNIVFAKDFTNCDEIVVDFDTQGVIASNGSISDINGFYYTSKFINGITDLEFDSTYRNGNNTFFIASYDDSHNFITRIVFSPPIDELTHYEFSLDPFSIYRFSKANSNISNLHFYHCDSVKILSSNLKDTINTDNMFENLGGLILVIGGVLIFAFTFRIIKKLISCSNKGNRAMI